MAQFAYSFCLAMLHSLWQSALLMLLYLAANHIFLQKSSPLAKRNFLFVLLLSQALLFTLSFFIFYSGQQVVYTEDGIGKTISGFIYNQGIEKAAPWVFLGYTLVIIFRLANSVFSWISFKKKYKLGLQRPVVDLKLFTEMKAHQFGITRKVKLWFSNTIHTPVTFGFFKPVILLPVALMNNISTRQAETLIIHELTHIRTNDYLLNWFLLFIETVFFFNPFIRSFCNRVRMEREKNCDMGVMAFEYSPVLYAETLLQAEQMKQLVPGFQLAAVNRKKQLLNRIRFFSGEINFARPARFNMIVPLAGLMIMLLLSSALLFKPGGLQNIAASATTLPYLPFGSIETPESRTYTAEPIANAVNPTINKPAEVDKQISVAEKKSEELQSVIDELGKEAEALAAKQAELTYVMPITSTETDGDKQIIIQEESSGSRSATVKTYTLRYENGQWILEPVWSLSAKDIPEDSLLKKMDSSNGKLKRVVPRQQ